MPSQQGVFPKRSLGKNPKIDHFSPTTKPHPLNPLTEGLPFLYWLGTRGWCSGASVCIPLPSAFVFFYSYTIFAILTMSHSVVLAMSHSAVCLLCSCLSSMAWRVWAFRLGHWLGRSPCPCSPLGFCSYYFSSYYAHGPIGYHSCHVSPLNFLPIFLGFHNPFTLLLSLVMPMGLLVVIPAILAHYAFYLFSWASKAHLLYLYLLLCIWAYWLPFMPCWTIRLFTFFLGLLRPIYFTFTL